MIGSWPGRRKHPRGHSNSSVETPLQRDSKGSAPRVRRSLRRRQCRIARCPSRTSCSRSGSCSASGSSATSSRTRFEFPACSSSSRRGPARTVGHRRDRRPARLHRRRAPAHARRVVHPLPRRAPALDPRSQPGRDRPRAARDSRRDHHRARRRLGRGSCLRRAVVDGAPHRRGARADRPRDPHPALRPHRHPPEDRADGDRRVGAQRLDRRRARAGVRRRRPQRDASVTRPAFDFLEDLGISTALGIGFGVLLSLVVSDRRAGVWRESAAIAVVAVVAVGYFSIDSAGGSGYLGAFLAGLIVGNMDRLRLGMHSSHERDMRVFVDTITESS